MNNQWEVYIYADTYVLTKQYTTFPLFYVRYDLSGHRSSYDQWKSIDDCTIDYYFSTKFFIL